MKLFFAINETKSEARAAFAELERAATRLGLILVGESHAADVVIAVGGDGTILRTVRENPSRPVLGLNFGGLGYLSSVGRSDFSRALELLAAGRYQIAERTMLSVRGARDERGQAVAEKFALNDVVVERELSGRAVILDFSADGKSTTSYLGDGLIVATPTGSTAYSLSAGGPVVAADTASFVVTPLNPHALGVRPLVLSDRVTIEIRARARTDARVGKIGVYADGVVLGFLEAESTLTLAKAERSALFVELEGYDPYAVLARKLGWSGMNAI